MSGDGGGSWHRAAPFPSTGLIAGDPVTPTTLYLQVSQLNDRLRFGPEEAVELIADDPLLVHLEQRHAAAGGKIS